MAVGSFANAASTGAKTVNSPPLRVSTRLTLGLSLPETAAMRVFSSGLLQAATATGSAAMPATEPAPSGTCLGVVGAAGADEVGGRVGGGAALGSGGAALACDGAALLAVSLALSSAELSLPQAAVMVSADTTAVRRRSS